MKIYKCNSVKHIVLIYHMQIVWAEDFGNQCQVKLERMPQCNFQLNMFSC